MCKYIYFKSLTVKCTERIIRINFWISPSVWKVLAILEGSLSWCARDLTEKKSAWLAMRFYVINLALFDNVLKIFEPHGFLLRLFFFSKVLNCWTSAMWEEYNHHRCDSHGNVNLATKILYSSEPSLQKALLLYHTQSGFVQKLAQEPQAGGYLFWKCYDVVILWRCGYKSKEIIF